MNPHALSRPNAVRLVVLLVAVALAVIIWGRSTDRPGHGDTPLTSFPSVLGSSGSPRPSTSGSAGASPTSAPDQVILAAGDIATCGLPADAETARLIEGMTGTVLALGDIAYESGTAKEFTDCYDPTWGAFKDRTYAVPGNHDWGTKGLTGYLGYWGSRAVNKDGSPWYSFDLGSWHLIALDADCASVGGCDASSKQGQWLASDLAAAKTQCSLAFWHQPRFSSGIHGNDGQVSYFWQALMASGAEIVLNGHDHDYERFAPQDANGGRAPDRGIREFVVGTGGAALRGFVTTRPNSRVRISTEHGILRVVLRSESYDWAFIGTDGSTLDEGHATCH